MKVICIDATNTPACDPHKLIEGNIYTAEESIIYPTNWVIIEIGFMYLKRRFVPLSSIDETEFERNYKTEPVQTPFTNQ